MVYIRRGQPKLEPIFIALPVLVVLGRVLRCASAKPQKGWAVGFQLFVVTAFRKKNEFGRDHWPLSSHRYALLIASLEELLACKKRTKKQKRERGVKNKFGCCCTWTGRCEQKAAFWRLRENWKVTANCSLNARSLWSDDHLVKVWFIADGTSILNQSGETSDTPDRNWTQEKREKRERDPKLRWEMKKYKGEDLHMWYCRFNLIW